MNSRVPVPTDNIFKFAALFGLFLFVFAIGASIYKHNAANEMVFATIPELEGLQQIAEPTAAEKARIAVFRKRLEVTKSDRTFYRYALGGLAGIGLVFMFFGFYKWEKEVQPILDRTAKAQMEMAELQLVKLRRELGVEQAAAKAMSDAEGPEESTKPLVTLPVVRLSSPNQVENHDAPRQ